jgi:hypothetical protein
LNYITKLVEQRQNPLYGFGYFGERQTKMKIYRSNNIDPIEGDFCEKAIAADAFIPLSSDNKGHWVISINARDGEYVYVALVEVQDAPGFGKSLIIQTVRKKRPEELECCVNDLKDFYF